MTKLDTYLDDNDDGTEWIKMQSKLSDDAWIECDTSQSVRLREWR